MTQSHIFSVSEFEEKNKNLKLIYSDDLGSWAVSLYYNEDDGHYYVKGPFGRWDIPVYIDKGVMSEEQVQEFMKKYPKDPKFAI